MTLSQMMGCQEAPSFSQAEFLSNAQRQHIKPYQATGLIDTT